MYDCFPNYKCCHCYLNSSSMIINFLVGKPEEKHAPLVTILADLAV